MGNTGLPAGDRLVRDVQERREVLLRHALRAPERGDEGADRAFIHAFALLSGKF